MIEGFDKELIGPASYDLRLGNLFKHKGNETITNGKAPTIKEIKLPYTIKPKEFVLGKSIEKLKMPIHLIGIAAPKSRTFRSGLDVVTSIVDPGYEGELIFGIYNIGSNNIELTNGMPIVKLLFLELKGEPIPLHTKYMGGKVV
jgi:dCTP deaminase